MCFTTDEVESKMPCEMQCFTIETAAGGHESRRCQTAGAGYVRTMSALWSRYVCAMSAPVRLGPHCNGGLDVLRNGGLKVGRGFRWWLRVIRDYKF